MEKTRRRLMIEDMQLRGLSPHTQAAHRLTSPISSTTHHAPPGNGAITSSIPSPNLTLYKDVPY